MTKLNHQEFTAEMFTDENGQKQVTIRQEDYSGNGDNYVVTLDGWQLREICERLGLLASDHQAAKTISTLTRRMKVLADRIEHLADYMNTHSDTRHADLTFELANINALDDIAAEFVAELDDQQPPTDPPKQTTEPSKPKEGADPRQLSIEA